MNPEPEPEGARHSARVPTVFLSRVFKSFGQFFLCAPFQTERAGQAVNLRCVFPFCRATQTGALFLLSEPMF